MSIVNIKKYNINTYEDIKKHPCTIKCSQPLDAI